MNTTYNLQKCKQLLIKIWLLALMLTGAGEAWGQRTESINPDGTLELVDGVTYKSIKLNGTGDYTIIVNGTSTIEGKTIDGPDEFYTRGALIVKSGQRLIIKGTGILEAKASSGFWVFDWSQNHGDYAVPAIQNDGQVTIQGAVCVVATGLYDPKKNSDVPGDKSIAAPGIGGFYLNRVGGEHYFSSASKPITLEDGGTLIEVQPGNEQVYKYYEQLPQINIKDFGCFMSKGTFKAPSGYDRRILNSTYNIIPNRPATDRGIPLKFNNWGGDKNIRLKSGWEKTVNVYFQKSWDENPTRLANNYGMLDGIPFPSGTNGDQTVHVGLYYDSSNTYYKAFNTFSSKDLTLNTGNYPATGTLDVSGNSSFNGNKSNCTFNPNGALFKTSGSGTLKLTNINASSGTLKVEGQVYIPSGTSSNALGVGVVKDNKLNVSVYQNITTLQQDHTISRITSNGTAINCYYLDGRTLYLWLPNGDQDIRIETGEGVIYTANEPIGTTHKYSNSLTVYPTEFDLSRQTLALNTANSGNQTVSYPNASDGTRKDYTSLAKASLVFFDSNTSGAASNNNAIIQGSNVANVTLSDLNNSGTSASCLQITEGATANITLKGTNQLTTTGISAIDIATGTLNLSGQANSSLTAKGANADINVNATGYLNIATGDYSIRAKSSKFNPVNTTLNGGMATNQPMVYMGDGTNDKYYLAILPDNSGYSEYKKMDGSSLDGQMATKDSKSYFWISENSNQIQAKKDGTAYVLGRNKNEHNFNLTATPIIARIGDKAYSSIPEAFAAAKNAEVIKLEANDHIVTGDATLANITKGQKVQFLLNGKTLKTAGRTLNANEGVLELTGPGELNGDCNIKGGLYTSGSITLGNIFMDGKQVYRVAVSGLATGINSFPYFKLDDATSAYRATYAEGNNTVIWLPASPTGSIAIIADGSNATPEPVSEAVMTAVNSNHANTATAGPAPDITFGNITFDDGTASGINVTYGTGGKFKQDNMALTANNRVRLRGNNKNKANQIIVNELTSNKEAFFTLSNLRSDIGTAAGAAMLINGTANMMLEKENELRGGRGGSNSTAIVIDSDVSFTICNSDADKGRNSGKLLAQGSYAGNTSSHAIQQNSGRLKVEGGTLVLLNGDGTTDNAVSIPSGGNAILYTGGSLRSGSNLRPKAGAIDVYMVTISTGLAPGKPYRYTYKPGKADGGYIPPKDSYVIPDEDGKIYCWFPKAEAGAADLGQVVLVDPETSQSVGIPIAKVDQNDKNVAPIMISVQNLITNEELSYGNLKDAFDALLPGTQGNLSKYKLSLLSNVANLRTEQILPAYCDAEFNLGSYNVEVVSGSGVSFETPETSFLHVTGKGGNIRNTFKIAGDVFINGIVPLTDATIMRDNLSVFRTLISGLTWAPGNEYTYIYGKYTGRFVPHTVTHNGQSLLLGCLWLPDNGAQTELRVTVNSSGSAIEYTAGQITTKTQITEPLPVYTVGVVATVGYNATNVAFNSLAEAFSVGVKKANDAGYDETDAHPATLTMMAGNTFAAEFTMTGKCRIDLTGKNLLSSPNGKMKIDTDGSKTSFRIIDSNVGVKGSIQSDIILPEPTQLFVAGSISVEGNVTNGTAGSPNLWRTVLNTSYKPEVASVEYAGKKYPVVSGEVCLWLESSNDNTKVYTFTLYDKDGKTVGDKNGTVELSGYVISADHRNEMTIGVVSYEARIGTNTYPTLQQAFDDAITLSQTTPVELVKTIAPKADLTVSAASTGKNIIFDLGRYAVELTTGKALVVDKNVLLELRSTGGQGRMKMDVRMQNGGLFFAGQTIGGDNLGYVYDGATQKFRLQVKNLPKGMPDDVYSYTYGEDADNQIGSCMVRDGIACLWLTRQLAGKTLTFTANGATFSIKNVIIAPNHFNVETYGVNEVAQVSGNKYSTLNEAFAAAGGKKIVLLKNATLEQAVTVSAKNTELDMAGYNITASAKANTITVSETGTFRVQGKGNLATDFNIKKSDQTIASNGNLIVEPEVNLDVTSFVDMEDVQVYRANISGLPQNASRTLYKYNTQSGQATTSASGTLCVWLTNSTTPQTFRVDIGNQTWLLPSVVIGSVHNNPILVTPAQAVAEIGSTSYNTLEDAFAAVKSGELINLTKDTETGKALIPAVASAEVTLSLGKKKLTLGYGASLDANGGQLILTDGILEGDAEVKGNLFASGDVRMNNIMMKAGGKTVWRTLLTLPGGTGDFSYKIGNGTEVTGCKNIWTVGGKPVACLWLPAANVAQDVVVKVNGSEYKLTNAVVASTHGNELDVTAGNDPVASIGGVNYASLASAFAMAKDKDVIELKKSVAPSTVLAVNESVTLKLNGKTITSVNSGFGVATGKTLTLVNSGAAPVALQGTFQLTGDGLVDAGAGVKISGVVQDKDYKEVYRVLVDVGGAKECHWLHTYPLEYDKSISSGGKTYEVTVSARLGNHEEILTAYEKVVLSGAVAWKGEHSNKNIVLETGCTWTIGTGGIIHRLTIHEGANIVATAQVTATAGIRYVRQFAEKKWQSVALPYNSARITTLDAEGKPILRVPATGSGTSGDFWLNTMLPNGQQQTVSSTEMTANETYIMAVPADLKDMDIYFESGSNQLLRKNKVLAVKPQTGFAAYANGTLNESEITEKCYILEEQSGEMVFARYDTYTLLPFTGYLLADLATTENTPVLRVGVPTDIPDIRPDKQGLELFATSGYLVVTSPDSRNLSIWSVDGRCIKIVRLEAGNNRIPLVEGFYAVSRQIVYIPR